jgi:predicted nucleic acid-binding protein
VLFADTSALFAFVVRDAPHHHDAVRVESEVRKQREQVWTIDPVLAELWLLLRRDFGTTSSDAVIARLLEHGLRREILDDEDFRQAIKWSRVGVDQDFSLTHRQAFAVFERLHRWRAWSYDVDFSVVRVGPARDRALEVIR